MQDHSDPFSALNRTAPRWGFWASLGGLAVSVLWGLGMFVIGGKAPVQAVLEHPTVYRLTFLVCFFGPLVEIAALVALAVLAAQRSPMRAVVGALIALVYVPLNLSCYFLNAAVQPRLAAAPSFGPMERTISALLSMEHPYSLYGSLDILGYGLLGVGGLLIMSALWGRSRLWTWATAAWALCTVGCVAGPVGIVLDSRMLTNGSVAGGAVSVVSWILTALAFRQEQRGALRESSPQ
jgi:hypothetical protein